MATTDNTLLVRHLPSQLADADKEELLRHFGAVKVRIMGNTGPMKHTAFVQFKDKISASKALNRLHQLDILGHRLVVEFAKESQQKCFPSQLDYPRQKEITIKKEKDAQKTEDLPSKDPVYKKWSIDYPRNPKLCYLYPPPTVSILTNIANALAGCPKFYFQVLHLMNKMNLPAPFSAVTPNPPIPMHEQPVIKKPDKNVVKEEVEVPSSEESEIESEGESQKVNPDQAPSLKRRINKNPTLPMKRPRILQQNPLLEAPQPVPVVDPQTVFENVQKQPHVKRIEMRIPESISQEAVSHTDNPISDTDMMSIEEMKDAVSDRGFGKIEPAPKVSTVIEMTDSDLPYTVDPQKFRSLDDIRSGRIKKSEWKNFSVFKKYEAGEKTKRLYLKNLHKSVDEQDLVNIYGHFIDWQSETEKSMFDIRLMKEGRMKGQAFLTFPTEESAERALTETNGFVLLGKPLAVQYARSAKAKDTEETKS